MATETTPKMVQIVGREEDRDRVFDKEGLERLIINYCDINSTHDYAVFSIVGAQSSGKSTLMNAIFGTEFQVMNAKEGRKATTKGIWASICNQPPVVVLDIEGSDGAQQEDAGFENQSALFALCVSDVIFVNIGINDVGLLNAGSIPLLHRIFQEDAGFENQSALFALCVSDVIFVNIGINDVGLLNAGSIPLLHRIFQERVNHEMRKTVMVFAVRDYDEETPMDTLRGNLRSAIQKIYGLFPKEQRAKLEMCFELNFEFLRHQRYKTLEFGKDCTEIACRIREFLRDEENKLPIGTFPEMAEHLWKDILQNRRLDMASYWNIASEKGCKEIMSKKLKSIRSNKDYESLTTGDLKQPRVYCKTLDTILQSILSEYDRESQHYTTADAEEVRKMLKDNILEGAKEGFKKTMKNFVEVFLKDTSEKIQPLLKKNLFENMKQLVKENSTMFWNETKDLDFYHDVVKECQQDTKKNLKILTKAVRDKEVAKFIGWYGPLFAKFTGKLIIAATSGVVLPTGIENVFDMLTAQFT